uniref:Periplasmic heavy metal sensor n=1 Tax=Prevotella sp. GTC17260 TaxID=3236796 RepID=A0AB33J8P0_9BACT
MKNFKMLVAALLLSVSATAMAADKSEMDRPSQKQRIGLKWKQVAARLMLSDEQTEKLASTYADFCKEMRALSLQRMGENGGKKESLNGRKVLGKRAMKRGFQAKGRLTDTQIAKLTKQRLENQRRRIDIQEKYFDKFSKVLTARQAAYLINHAGRPHGMRRAEVMRRRPMRTDSMGHRQMFSRQNDKQG